MASISTNKRQRTAADTLHISDLPIGFIVNVTAYLPKPSRALLALAFTSSSLWENDDLMHRPSPVSKAIVSASQWDILDFEDISKELTKKLTDNDIKAVLQCINAHDVIKRLKLCGCVNIEGHGLNPLRGSVVLEQIDISFSGKYKQQDIDQSKIIQAAIVPILDSIISVNGCSLKYIQFPKKWRYIGTHNAAGEIHPISGLRTRFNEYLHSRTSLDLDCSKCNRRMTNYREWLDGMFENTIICYECLKPTCYNCDTEEASFCVHCRKKYCTDCIPVTECTSCDEEYCKGCMDMTCDKCGYATCEDCLNTCDGCNRTLCGACAKTRYCEEKTCDKSHCDDCYNGKGYSVKECGDCDTCLCNECKLIDAKVNVNIVCHNCLSELFPLLVVENEKQKKEITQLREELDEAYRET